MATVSRKVLKFGARQLENDLFGGRLPACLTLPSLSPALGGSDQTSRLLPLPPLLQILESYLLSVHRSSCIRSNFLEGYSLAPVQSAKLESGYAASFASPGKDMNCWLA